MNRDYETWASTLTTQPLLLEAFEAGRVRGFNSAVEQIRSVDTEHPVLGELDFQLRSKQ